MLIDSTDQSGSFFFFKIVELLLFFFLVQRFNVQKCFKLLIGLVVYYNAVANGDMQISILVKYLMACTQYFVLYHTIAF